MPRIQPISRDTAQGRAKELLDAVHAKYSFTPNLAATMANAPAVLDGYLSLSGALAGGSLSVGIREQIALAVAGVNGCEYCASAHTLIGKGAGVPESELTAALEGEPSDPKAAAAVRFARTITEKRGWATDAEIQAVRDAGFNDGEVLELVGAVVLNTLTNYVNHVAQTDVDFPLVRIPQPSAT